MYITSCSGKLDNLQKEYSDVKKSLTQVQARLSRIEEEKQNLTSNVGQLTTSNHELISMKQQLETEKRTLESKLCKYGNEYCLSYYSKWLFSKVLSYPNYLYPFYVQLVVVSMIRKPLL